MVCLSHLGKEVGSKSRGRAHRGEEGGAGGLRSQWGLTLVTGGGVLDRGWGGMVPDWYSAGNKTVGLRAMKKLGLQYEVDGEETWSKV